MTEGTSTLAVLMTCHNRVRKTCQCLQHLFAQKLPPPFSLQVYLVDDGSSDGTSDQIRLLFPRVNLLAGTGELFWCGGMRLAWGAAAKTDPDYYLLLNDDTNLLPDALETLLSLVPSPLCMKLAVGAIADPETGKWNYGGIPQEPNPVGKTTPTRTVKTFNGNCVLIPRCVFKKLGTFHSIFTHSMGDLDYGYAAARQGVPIFETGRFVGTCPTNREKDLWRNRSLSLGKRILLLNSPKGLPYREWFVFCKRNYGWFWFLRWLSPTVRIVLGL